MNERCKGQEWIGERQELKDDGTEIKGWWDRTKRTMGQEWIDEGQEWGERN